MEITEVLLSRFHPLWNNSPGFHRHVIHSLTPAPGYTPLYQRTLLPATASRPGKIHAQVSVINLLLPAHIMFG